MKTAEEIETTEMTTTGAEASVLTLVEVNQVTIEVVVEICHITVVIVISQTNMIDTATMGPEAKEGKGKSFFILYLQLTNFFYQISI